MSKRIALRRLLVTLTIWSYLYWTAGCSSPRPDLGLDPEDIDLKDVAESSLLREYRDPIAKKNLEKALRVLESSRRRDAAERHHLPKVRDYLRESFTVYDCGANEAVHRALDLHGPQECENIEPSHRKPINIEVQVLMVDAKAPVSAYSCQVLVTKEVSRCGYDSLHYGTQVTELEVPSHMTPAQCREAVRTGRFEYDGEVIDVVVNSPAYHSFYSHGFLADDHTCHTESFRSGKKRWYKSYELTIVKVMVRSVKGWVSRRSGRVVFANHIVANFMDKVATDDELGTFVWEVTDVECEQKYSQVYNGTAKLYSHTNSTSLGSPKDLIMYEVAHENRFAGFVIRNAETICNRRGFATQVPSIKVLILKPGESPMNVSTLHHGDILEAQLHSNIAYVHLTRSLHTDERFIRLHSLICKNERSILFQRLSLLSDDNSAALLESFGPGHTVTRAGGVAYVTVCAPVRATLRTYGNCTQEIPVMVGNKTLFADPLLLTLKHFPTIVPCDHLIPIRWRINDEWFEAKPSVTKSLPPEQLNPESDEGNTGSLQDFTRGLGSGAFSDRQRAEHREFMELYGSRSAVVAEVTRNAIFRAATTGRSRLNSYYSDLDFDDLKLRIGHALVPFFRVFGEGWTIFMGFLVIFSLVKLIIGCILRMCAAYARLGCGLWVLTAVWETLFLALTVPYRMVVNTADPNINQPNLPFWRRWRRPPSSGAPGSGHGDLPDETTLNRMGYYRQTTPDSSQSAPGRFTGSPHQPSMFDSYPKRREANESAQLASDNLLASAPPTSSPPSYTSGPASTIGMDAARLPIGNPYPQEDVDLQRNIQDVVDQSLALKDVKSQAIAQANETYLRTQAHIQAASKLKSADELRREQEDNEKLLIKNLTMVLNQDKKSLKAKAVTNSLDQINSKLDFLRSKFNIGNPGADLPADKDPEDLPLGATARPHGSNPSGPDLSNTYP